MPNLPPSARLLAAQQHVEKLITTLNDPDPRGFYVSQALFWQGVAESSSCTAEVEYAQQIVAESEAAIATFDATKSADPSSVS